MCNKFTRTDTGMHATSMVPSWIGIVCLCVPFIGIMWTDATNWTKIKQKHGGHLKQSHIEKELLVADFTQKN
jgi:hypothetical protein